MYEAAEAKTVFSFVCSMKCQPNHHPGELERPHISLCSGNRGHRPAGSRPCLKIFLKGALQPCTGAGCGAPLRGGRGVGGAVKNSFQISPCTFGYKAEECMPVSGRSLRNTVRSVHF